MEEFEEIYRNYQPEVFRFVLRLTGYDPQTAEELTQETFYQAFLSFSRFRGACSMRTWLFQIAKNVYAKFVRRESRQRALTQSGQAESVPAPNSAIEEQEMLSLLRTEISALEEPARSVVQYRLYADTGYAEIAALLHIKPNTAAVIYNRTIARLRKRMKERYGYEI